MSHRSRSQISSAELLSPRTEQGNATANNANQQLRELTDKFRDEIRKPDLCGGLVQSIPRAVENQLHKLLTPNERVLVQINGAIKEVLICTDLHVIIMGTCTMAEQTFERDIFQAAYSEITSAKVNFGISGGYFEVCRGHAAPSVFPPRGEGSDGMANTVFFRDRGTADIFRCVGAFIMAMSEADGNV